jgi:hypothetical protein
MPRKSAAALAIVPKLVQQRPEPPEGLTEEQAEEWRAIVNQLPPDWFSRESHALLVAYVKHVADHRRLSHWLDQFRDEWMLTADGVARYDKLLTMREREGRAMSSLATRMRLTQQSRYSKDKVTKQAAPIPWAKEA